MVHVKTIMEELKGYVNVENGEMIDGLDSREIATGFTYPYFPLTNPIVISDFKQKQKAQTCIRLYHQTFGCDPTDRNVMWWLEYQYRVNSYVFSFLCVFSKIEINQHNYQNCGWME